MKKKLLSALLALVMVLTMLPLTAFAEDSNTQDENGVGKAEWLDTGRYYTVSEYLTDVNLTKANITEGTGVVTSLVGLKEAALNLEYAKKANENSTEEKKTELAQTIAAKETSVFGSVTKLDLSSTEGMTSETNVGFLEPFTSLTELNLSGCTALEDIGALANCTELTKLDLNGCTALANIGALADCTKLTTLDLSSCTSLKSIAALAECTGLTTLDISDLSLEGLESIGSVEQLAAISNLTLTNTTWTLEKNVSEEGLARAMAAMNYLNAKKEGNGLKLQSSDGDEITLIYTITVANDPENNANGNVTVTVSDTEVTTADAGDTVTITATPDAGYAVQSVSVTKFGTKVEVTDNNDGTYSFTMPATDVNVDVRFKSTKNDNLHVNNITPDNELYAKLKVVGMKAGRTYLVQITTGPSISAAQVVLVVDGTTYQSSGYTFSCQAGRTVNVFELNEGVDVDDIELVNGTANLGAYSSTGKQTTASMTAD